jgi:hypothetical protein
MEIEGDIGLGLLASLSLEERGGRARGEMDEGIGTKVSLHGEEGIVG